MESAHIAVTLTVVRYAMRSKKLCVTGVLVLGGASGMLRESTSGGSMNNVYDISDARKKRELKSYFQRIFDEALDQGVELTSVADVVNDTPYIAEYEWGKVKEVREL